MDSRPKGFICGYLRDLRQIVALLLPLQLIFLLSPVPCTYLASQNNTAAPAMMR